VANAAKRITTPNIVAVRRILSSLKTNKEITEGATDCAATGNNTIEPNVMELLASLGSSSKTARKNSEAARSI
jgi:hypothetical protein